MMLMSIWIVPQLLIIVIIFVAQLLVCHSAELLEALERTTNMTEEQLKQVELRNLFVFEVGPSAKFVSAIIDAIFKKNVVIFLFGKMPNRGGGHCGKRCGNP